MESGLEREGIPDNGGCNMKGLVSEMQAGAVGIVRRYWSEEQRDRDGLYMGRRS